MQADDMFEAEVTLEAYYHRPGHHQIDGTTYRWFAGSLSVWNVTNQKTGKTLAKIVAGAGDWRVSGDLADMSPGDRARLTGLILRRAAPDPGLLFSEVGPHVRISTLEPIGEAAAPTAAAAAA